MSISIYFWKSASAASEELVMALRAADRDVIRLGELAEVLERCERKQPHLIIADASADEKESSQRLIELANTPALYPIPLVFIAQDAVKKVEILSGSYRQVLPIDAPYRIEALLQSASILFDDDSQVLAGSSTSNEEGTASLSEESDVAGGQPEVVSSGRIKRKVVPENTEAILRRVAQYPDPTRLKDSFGGVTFALAREITHYRDDLLFPKDISSLPLEDFILKQTIEDPELGLHIRRLTFALSAIATSLSLGKKRDDLLRACAVLLNYKLREKAKVYRTYDFFLESSEEVTRIVSESFQQTAQFLRSNLNDTELADRIDAVAALLQEKKVELPAAVRQDAEIILAVELSLRSCWGKGHWDPSGVYRVLRAQRREVSPVKDKKVSFALAKLLGESVTKHVTVGNVFVHHFDEDNPEPVKTTPNVSSSPPLQSDVSEVKPNQNASMRAVSLSDLTPGMTLALPVYARDGRLVVAANTVLSEELLLDLWELASLRALRSNVEVLA